MGQLKKHIELQNQDKQETEAQAEEMEMDFNYEDDQTMQIEELEKQNTEQVYEILNLKNEVQKYKFEIEEMKILRDCKIKREEIKT